MIKNTLVAGIQVVTQIALVIMLVYWVVNPEDINRIIQVNYIIAYGLFLILWVLVDISYILYIRRKKKDHKKNEN